MQVTFRFYLNSGLGRPPKQPKYLQFRAEGCCGAYLGGFKMCSRHEDISYAAVW